jgi:plasmid stability protein
MGNILVRNVDDAAVARLKKKAKAAGKSMNDFVRATLHAAAKPSKEDIWAEIDRFRERIGPISGDSTADIREDRDNDEPYR